jgi:hypothetical protein
LLVLIEVDSGCGTEAGDKRPRNCTLTPGHAKSGVRARRLDGSAWYKTIYIYLKHKIRIYNERYAEPGQT